MISSQRVRSLRCAPGPNTVFVSCISIKRKQTHLRASEGDATRKRAGADSRAAATGSRAGSLGCARPYHTLEGTLEQEAEEEDPSLEPLQCVLCQSTKGHLRLTRSLLPKEVHLSASRSFGSVFRGNVGCTRTSILGRSIKNS